MTGQSLRKAIEGILDLARWAPSGDNAQPWRFRFLGEREVELLIRRANPNIYEYRQGEPTLISAGALLENIELAAPAFGMKAQWRYAGSEGGIDYIRVTLFDDMTASVSDLFDHIPRRSVDRRRYRMRSLSPDQKDSLAKALDPAMRVQWYESLSDRLEIAAVSALATNIRLTIPETFAVHRDIVDWKNQESECAIPSRALGLDPLTLLLTRWSMAKWSRTRVMNGLGAPLMASVQMDFLPGLFSASYFALRLARRSSEPDEAVVETLEAGKAIQRFWLTATRLGLVMQPCVAILAFWSYAAAGQEFTKNRNAKRTGTKLAALAGAVFGRNEDILFVGRIGWPRDTCSSRSTRLPLSRLMDPSPRFG